MKLQINLSGAWRNVMPYKPESGKFVRYYAASLAMQAEYPARLRTVMPDGQEVTAYFDPDKGWRTPRGEAICD